MWLPHWLRSACTPMPRHCSGSARTCARTSRTTPAWALHLRYPSPTSTPAFSTTPSTCPLWTPPHDAVRTAGWSLSRPCSAPCARPTRSPRTACPWALTSATSVRWRPYGAPPLAAVLPIAAGRAVIVDCRSSTYAAAWVPRGDLAARWVQIRVPGATHMAKHTRGLVARHLCESGVDARTAKALERVVAQRFETTLTKPARPGLPWILDTRIL